MSAPTSRPGASSLRPIRPAGGGGDGGGGADQGRDISPATQKKRKITAVACKACQRKRCKCDGGRPRCSACVAAGAETECVYDTRSDQSRLDALKEKNTRLEDENVRLRALLESRGGGEVDGYGDVISPAQQSSDITHRTSPGRFSASRTASDQSTAIPDPAGRYRQQSTSSRGPQSPQSGRTFAAPSSIGQSTDPNRAEVDMAAALEQNVGSLEVDLGQMRSRLSGLDASEQLQSSGSATRFDSIKSQWEQLEQNLGSLNPMEQLAQQTQGKDAKSRGFRWGGPLVPLGDGGGPSVGQDSSRQPFPYHHKPQRFGPHLDVFGNLPMSSGIMSNHHTGSIQSAQVINLRLPRHLIQMLNWEDHVGGAPQGVLTPEFASSTFSSFRAYGRRLIHSGIAAELVLGPNVVDVHQFFHTDQDPNTHTTATFAPWFLGAYPSMTITARVASAVLMQRLLRWQISPMPEHFDAIPEWLRATAPQIFIPHLSAFDFLPWPQIREILIDNDEPARQILAMIMSNLSMDWPGSTEEIFSWDYQQGVATGVNPAFIVHILDINNWGINSKVLRRFPYLEGKAKFVEMTEELEQRAVTATDRVYNPGDMEYAQ